MPEILRGEEQAQTIDRHMLEHSLRHNVNGSKLYSDFMSKLPAISSPRQIGRNIKKTVSI